MKQFSLCATNMEIWSKKNKGFKVNVLSKATLIYFSPYLKILQKLFAAVSYV